MSTGLLALLDDVAAIAKVAAASVDDVAALSGRAGLKATGIVIDDAAVTPRYVIGFGPERELPIVWRIARGSLRNKLLILLPAALALSAFAPFLITPLLMAGGLFLCFEGAEKLLEKLGLHAHHAEAEEEAGPPTDARALEEQRVAGAIRTDLILSAEIMAITLGTMPETDFITRAVVLAVVAVAMTAFVYGIVALIVKADDMGVALTRRPGAVRPAIGRAIVRGMPGLLAGLGLVGSLAMLWVGGGIFVHGLEEYGIGGPAHVQHAAQHLGEALPLGVVMGWLAGAAVAGVAGLVLGLLVAGVLGLVSRWRPAAG
jgi:predicted DNA repair protein MutK